MFCRCLLMGVVVLALTAGFAAAAETPTGETAAIQERYLAAALRNPRHGPAVEKLYQSATQGEGIDALIQQVRQDSTASSDAAKWTLVGLLQEMRGKDVEAIAAYEKASQKDAKAYYARYAAGLLLLHRNSYDKAIAQFNDALQIATEPTDVIEIRKALGRSYLRSRQLDKAKEVWSQLAKAAPDDAVTLQELIALLEDEEQWDEAITYYQQLQQMQKDRPYQVVLCMISLGKVEARRGHFDAALARYEEALAKVEPDSWLAEEIRARVQDLFRKRNDLTGLAEYYRAQVAKDARDVRTLVALAQLQVEMDQAGEARTNYEKALGLAPKDQAVRLAYIHLLETAKDYAAAIKQYETLVEQNPKQATYLEALGNAYLQQSKDEAGKEKARSVWRKMADLSAKDAATMVQVAEVFQSHGMKDDAGAYYVKAIELAPEVGQYREYYGEFLVKTDQRDKAVEVFSQIAAGPRESIQTVMRLSDVLSYFHFEDEAIVAARRAVAINGDHFEARMLLAKMLEAAEQYDEALTELDEAGRLAPKEFFVEQVVDARIRLLQRAGKLEGEYEKRANALATGEASPGAMAECAKMALTLGKTEPAALWVHKALVSRESVSLLELAATIYSRAGDGEGQVATLRKLIEKAPQNRGQYHQQLALYYSQAGDREEAFKAAEQVVAAAPDNADGYQLLSSICERFGQPERCLEILKKALKVDPKNQDLRIAYAKQLEQSGQPETAIEEYWQVYDAREEVADKMAAVRMLTQAAYCAGSFDQQVDRLERRRRVTQDDWVVALSLAEAFRQVEDFAKAREILTGLLAIRPGDRDLLGQVVRLAKSEGRNDEAARYLGQLAKMEPSRRNLLELGELLHEAGRQEEALAAWKQAAETGDDKAAAISEVISDLLNRQLNDAAVDMLAGYCQRNPDDWRTAYQYGAALLAAEKVDAADVVFLHVADLQDPPAQAAQPEGKSKTKDRDRDKDKSRQVRTSVQSAYMNQMPPEMLRLQKMQMVRYQVSPRYGNQQGAFVPTDLETARFAAWQQQIEIARKKDKFEELTASLKKEGTPAALWRLVQAVQNDNADNKDLLEAVELLSKAAPQDVGVKMLKMTSLFYAGSQQMAKVPYEQAKAAFEDMRKIMPPSMAMQMQLGWLQYLQASGHSDEVASLARQMTSKAFKDVQEGTMAFEALLMAGHVDEATAVLQQIDKQFSAGRKFGGVSGSFSYPRLAMLAISKGQADRAAELMLSYLRLTRPASTRGNPAGTSSMYYSAYNYASGSGGLAAAQQFPTPNAYYDDQRMSMLREFANTAIGGQQSRFGFLRQQIARAATTQNAANEEENIRKTAKAALAALRAGLEKDIESSLEDDRIYAHLGLAYLDWWADDKASAVKHMTAAAEIRPYDATLCLDLARVRYNTDDRKGALAALAMIQQRYQTAYKPAQQLLLQVAKELNDQETAKQAALRLFSMKLAGSEQLALAASLRELGLAAKAQQIEERVKTVSAQDTQQLIQLMEYYQNQGEKKQAAQVARQVLRTLNKSGFNQEYYRRQSLDILRQSGDLAQMIEDAEKQLQTTPESVRLLMDLFYYYSAKPDYAKARTAAEKAMSLRPKDAELRAQYATALQQAGQFDLAIEQFRIVFAQEPSRLFGDMWSIAEGFARAGQTDALIDMVADADWKKAAASVSGGWPGQFASNLVQIADRLGFAGNDTQVTWLADFEDTGQIIQMSQEFAPMARLYKKRFGPGKVELGKASDRGNNYFVLIVPAAEERLSTKASMPSIGDGAAGISCRAQLGWAGPKGATYDAYFGTTNPPPLAKRVTVTGYDPGELMPGTTYYWRVDTVTGETVTAGDLWSFTTSDLRSAGPVRAAIRFDRHKSALGMRHQQEINRSMTAQASIGGKDCRTILDTKTESYIYLYLEDEYMRQAPAGEQYVTVDYFDAGEGTINLSHPWAREAEGKGSRIGLVGSNTWKRQTLRLKDADFGNATKAYVRFGPVRPARIYLHQVQIGSQSDMADPYAVIQTDTADNMAPMRMGLYGVASFSPDGTKIVRYKWDFAGETAEGPVVKHTFNKPGLYTVALTVTDEAGRTNTRLTDIRVPVSAARIHDLSRYNLGTFSRGSVCFADWDVRVMSMPAALDGCMGIQTVNDHYGRNDDGSWLTFELDGAADVYVACDPRSIGGKNVLKLLDKLNDYVIAANIPGDTWIFPRVMQARTRALRAKDRPWEALNYLLACCKDMEGFRPAVPTTAPADWSQQTVTVKTQRMGLMESVYSWRTEEGDPEGVVGDLIELADKCGQLDAMREFLQGRYEKDKDARDGVWLALVNLQMDKKDVVRALVPELAKADFVTGNVTGQAYLPLLWLDKLLKDHKDMAAESMICCQAAYDIVQSQQDTGMSSLICNRLASRYIAAGNREDAAAVCRKILDLKPNMNMHPDNILYQKQSNMRVAAEGLNRAGQYQEAYEIADKLSKQPEPAQFQGGMPDQGKQLMTRIAAAHPEVVAAAASQAALVATTGSTIQAVAATASQTAREIAIATAPATGPAPTLAAMATVPEIQGAAYVLQQDLNGYRGCVDASIREPAVNLNTGDLPDLEVFGYLGHGTDGERQRALIRFDVASIPAGTKIRAAKLLLFNWNAHGRQGDYTLHEVARSWKKDNVTWNNALQGKPWLRPGGEFLPIVVSRVTKVKVENTWHAFDITECVQKWIDRPAENFGVLIRAEQEDGSVGTKYRSSRYEDVSQRPMLVVWGETDSGER